MPYDRPLAVWRYNRESYLVRSESRADRAYVVDLDDEEYPAGRCDCEDNNFRVEPDVRRGLKHRRCKHVRKVRATIDQVTDLCQQLGIPTDLSMIPRHEERE